MPVAPAVAASPSQPRTGWLHRFTRTVVVLMLAAMVAPAQAQTPMPAQATRVQTPYANPKAIVDVYLDHPAKMGSALYWLRSLVNPLTDAPYSLFPCLLYTSPSPRD